MKNGGKTAKAAKNDEKRQKNAGKTVKRQKAVKNGKIYSGGRL